MRTAATRKVGQHEDYSNEEARSACLFQQGRWVSMRTIPTRKVGQHEDYSNEEGRLA